MSEEERKEEKERQIRNVRLAIIAAATAVTAFLLCYFYSVRPVAIYNIQGTADGTVSQPAQTASLSSEESSWVSEAPESSEGREQEVLLEKSVDLNAATAEELDKLPGVGPVLAERIVQYRDENGGFVDIEELKSVDGIGEKIFEKMEPFVTAD